MKNNSYLYKKDDSIPVARHDLRALLFWASVGIAKSKRGSYPDIEESEGDPGILRSYAEHIKFKLPFAPRFSGKRTVRKP